MNEKIDSKKNAVFIINCSDYVICTISSILYILNVASNCYVSYCMLLEGHIEWFATSVTLLIVFSLFTQIFSHIFFTYNNIGDKACSPYLQHINAKSGYDDKGVSVVKKEFLEIERQTVCPHSGYSDRLWTDKDLVDLSDSQVHTWQKFCSQAVSVILHLFHIGPVLRYVHLLKFRAREMEKDVDQDDIEEKKIKDIERYFCKLCLLERAAAYSLRDITLLRLFEALEAVPQVLLQVYLVFYLDTFVPRLICPALLGTLQVSFCLALTVKYQRMPRIERQDQTTLGLCTTTLYKFFLITYRVVVLAVFGSLYRGYLILLLFTHSLLMLLWILYLDSNFSSSNHEEIAFNFTVSMLKSFTFVNVSDGRSRNRVVLYHVCMTIENVIIAGVWYYRAPVDYGLVALGSMGALYLVGVLIKTLYYSCCHPSKQEQGVQDLSVMYKNRGEMITNPIKDSTQLLKPDEPCDVIRFPTGDRDNASNTGSTWMLGFIEQKADSLSSKRHMMTAQPLRQRYNYDTYQSVSMDTCSGYDSEVASILSAKTPIYENLVPSSRHPTRHPPVQHPVQHPVKHPVSSFQHPVSSFQHPISHFPHPVSSFQHPVSNFQHPVSNFEGQSGLIQHHHNPPITNPMSWQTQPLNPPSGRNSAEPAQYTTTTTTNNNNNNDSLSSSGVYSEEERKLNLKARLDSEYDNIEDARDMTRHFDTSMSPDSDNGDLYENLPTVIRQGQQVHSDGITMQSISINGPQAQFDNSLDSSNQPWDLLKGSLNFAYGPRTSEYTCLKEVTPVVPARTTSSTVKSNLLAEESASQHSIDDPTRYQTDV